MHISLDWGETASSRYKRAFDFFENKNYTASARILTKEMAKNPDKHGYYALGICMILLENSTKAARFLLEAVKIDKFYHEALNLLGDIYFSHGQSLAAIESYAQAVAIDPSNEKYKQNLINIVGALNFKKTTPNLKGVLIECLESDHVEMIHFGRSWLSMVKKDSSTGPYYKLSKCKSYNAFKTAMEENFDNCDGLIDPFFLTGFGKFIVPDFSFENWIKNLRRYLLENIVEKKPIFSDESDIELITCALSRYCFLSDYVISFVLEEEDMLTKLDLGSLSGLACYGCYKPLYNLPDAKKIAANLEGGNHVSKIPKHQIENYVEQQEIIVEIETLVKIDDKTSKAVQKQYEDFPYPRWDVAATDLFNPLVEGHLKYAKAEILIAGCGTGKEAVQMAHVLPDAHITAIDLSKNSLAYGIFKARSFGINNIQFYQADIMNLAKLPDWQERFDYIASGGVLHHMKDPFEGWRILCRLLKDEGLMRLGLYSNHARRAINEARKVIKDAQINSDSNSIRNFRDNINNYLKYKTIKKFESLYDYYTLPECRDLLFHVQEHQFDLLRIKELLDKLELEFLQFYHDPNILRKYHNQNATADPQGKNLEIWNRFEKKNPDTFISMYRFWCKKLTRS